MWDSWRDLIIVVGSDSAGLVRELQAKGHRRVVVFHPEAVLDGVPAPTLRTLDDLRAHLASLPDPLPRQVTGLPASGVQTQDALFRAAMDAAREALEAEGMARETRRRFGGLWMQHLRHSLPRLRQLPTVARLDGCLAGRPAVLVSAGPSLDRNISVLRAAQGRALIVANNRSAAALWARGILADLIVVSDALTPISHLRGLPLHQVGALALEVAVSPSLFSVGGAKTIFIANALYAPQAEAILGSGASVVNGGSVATCAFTLARRMGCDPLILAGHDLALTEGRGYAGRAGGAPAARRGTVTVAGYQGGEVQTSTDFYHHLRWFEDQAVQAGTRPLLLNCTEGGARISGFQQVRLEEALARHLRAPVTAGLVLRTALGHAPAIASARGGAPATQWRTA